MQSDHSNRFFILYFNGYFCFSKTHEFDIDWKMPEKNFVHLIYRILLFTLFWCFKQFLNKNNTFSKIENKMRIILNLMFGHVHTYLYV